MTSLLTKFRSVLVALLVVGTVVVCLGGCGQKGGLYLPDEPEKKSIGPGFYIFSPEGKELAYVKTPSLPTNCCFGRAGEISRLYVTAGGGFYRIQTNATGYHPALD